MTNTKNKVKRFATAFLYFKSAKYNECSNNNPELKVHDVIKLLGQEWKEMTDEQKEPWMNLSKIDSLRYYSEKKDLKK